jgi:two-component system, OmpR family, phosphate regulon sensor histidine kinase PhoR
LPVNDAVLPETATNAGISPGVRRGFLVPALIILTILFGILYMMAPELAGERQGSLRAWVEMLWLAGVICMVAARHRQSSERRSSQRHIEEMLEKVARGEFGARSSLERAGELGTIAAALNRVVAGIELRLSAVESERDELKLVLGAMEDGVLVVDTQQRVQISNAAARRMLACQANTSGRALQDICRIPELLDDIGGAVSRGIASSVEFKTPPNADGQQLVLVARSTPFDASPQHQRGAVIVLHDITELRRLEGMRSEFVANVSHELRTPLTSLLGYLETLQDESWEDPAEAQRFLSVCRRQAERLGRIVEDLLRLSRLESPHQLFSATEVDLGDIINSALESLRPLAKERGVTLLAEAGGRRAVVVGDRGLLIQAVSNLVENAINYNRDGGQVTVRLSGSGGRGPQGEGYEWSISVTDTGVGIPPEAIPRIFERFYRVDKARSRERGGTGLGLSIVKHIAHAHEASVQVESEVEKGSTFTLRFRSVADASSAQMRSE